MADRSAELRAILANVKARWSRRAFLRAWMLGAITAAAMLMVGLLAVWLLAQNGIPLVIVVLTVGLVAGVSLSFAFLPLRRQPSDRQIARFIEEQAGGLDEVVVTAVDKSATQSGPMIDLLVADAIRAAAAVDPHRIVTRDSMMRAVIGGAIGTIVFAIAFALFAPSASRAMDVAGSYLFPSHYAIDVTPGSIKIREGQPVVVTARIPGIDGAIVPMITVGQGEAARSAKMTPSGAKATDGKAGASRDEFTITLNNIKQSFPYVVTAGSASSPAFHVDVIRPVKVSRIDVKYEYAPGLGLEPHTDHDGGDIYAPAGTKIQLTITADKSVANGQVKLADGSAVALTGHNQVFTADLVVAKDSSYRVALNDVDGLSNDGGTEYLIRMLNDRPPDVRIVRPAGDKEVAPLEEVVLEARADDDYGVRSLELVIKANSGKEKVVPIGAPISGTVATGDLTLFLEDLKVKPGDVVTYYARATDVGKGRRPTESRSDIFFLEVKPYEEEFVASEGQSGGQGEQQTGLEELIAQQKDIMAATWKLDARARRAGASALSPPDVKAIGRAQSALQAKAEEVAMQLSAGLAAQRRRQGPTVRGLTRPNEDPLPLAVEAMGRAAQELDRVKVAAALPHEEEALSQLLKAAAEIRRRQIALQQARGGGSGGNRERPDLSTLFDQELRKKQETNYEQQSTTQDTTAQNNADEDPLAAIRELARRQEGLSKQQRDLAKSQEQMTPEEVKRQLERLTREQQELQKKAEELAKKIEAGPPSRPEAAPARSRRSSPDSSRAEADAQEALRQATEQMRQAAGDLQRQDPQRASASGAKAGEQLRGAEQRMQGSRPEERRRAIGDMRLEAQQIAEAERRLGNEASRTAAGSAGEDARRKLAGEQDRLADRTQRLGDAVKQMSCLRQGSGEAGSESEQQAMSEAGKELDKQNVAGRMREAAQAMRNGHGADQKSQGPAGNAAGEIARALDKVAEQLGSAAAGRDAESAKLSEQLSRTQQLRDQLGKLQRSMDDLNQPGGRDVTKLQRDVDEQMKEAQRLAQEMQRENPGKQNGLATPEQWQRSVSAPGTEAFKQDFSKWEELKKNLLVALDQTESHLSEQLRARENRERLNAGRHDAVADTYRELVDRYYQSLAAPRPQKSPKPQPQR
jgi:hypothetical protein